MGVSLHALSGRGLRATEKSIHETQLGGPPSHEYGAVPGSLPTPTPPTPPPPRAPRSEFPTSPAANVLRYTVYTTGTAGGSRNPPKVAIFAFAMFS